jgi:hypothetical protein
MVTQVSLKKYFFSEFWYTTFLEPEHLIAVEFKDLRPALMGSGEPEGKWKRNTHNTTGDGNWLLRQIKE